MLTLEIFVLASILRKKFNKIAEMSCFISFELGFYFRLHILHPRQMVLLPKMAGQFQAHSFTCFAIEALLYMTSI